ncbi:hypothetical protein TNCV_25161 [Trichonephila clavipes]|uniref:Uncharacterized protein n=1 Tax=Trichonephila clavipes TaxID=2585209 RepID=A0A8X6W1E0_TRICX|nr:hypothetical protein TNCV_25161 [Trichonephila clavipes]
MLSDARELADEIDIPANFELTQPRHTVRRRNVNFDYEARDDPIEGLSHCNMDNSDHDRTDYTSAYLEFHKSWDTGMSNVLEHLNESRTSDDSSAVIRETEELDSKLRE